jgi:Tfp pilus assembly protein PilX
MTASATPTSHRPSALRRQDGITMLVTIGVMLVTSLLLIATFTAANGDIQLTHNDTSAKKAYYAAQAGIDDYAYHLTQDGNYLSYCTEPPTSNPALNQFPETTHRATVPSTNGEATNEQYAIQLLPAESAPAGDHKCDREHLVETMLEEKTGGPVGTFRIESTGYSGGEKRTLVATFRNANFVSYVWYTKYETGDPTIHGPVPEGKPSTWWTECGQFYGIRPSHCSVPYNFDNYFGAGESVNGPMHTEDHVGVCGEPTKQPIFGRNEYDRIEFGHSFGGDEGYSNEGCGIAKPLFKGDHIPPKEVLPIEPPPGDEELQHIVEPAYLYKEKTEIALEGSTMTVKTHVGTHTVEEEEEGKKEETQTGVAFPPNGVIYVAGGCSETYSPFGPKPAYSADTACGNVYVHGEYTSSLTIASENDIVINGNITTPHNGEGKPTSNALLGLIANNFVRIYHPLTGSREKAEYLKCGSSKNDTTEEPKDLNEPTVYAAILAVKHAVIVDNFDCGTPTLGHLNIYGAVAGLFTNGMTGVINGGTLIHGYGYNANYDNRLQVEEPPHFLNPIQAAWYVQRETVAPSP